MKHLLVFPIFIFTILIIAGHAQAQSSALCPAAGAIAYPVASSAPVSSPGHSLFQTEDETPFQLAYDTTSLSTFEWLGHGLYTPYVIVDLGERFTLPSATGFVDSVAIELDSITRDSVTVALAPDTFYQTANGAYHLINIFIGLSDPFDFSSVAYATATVHAGDVHSGTFTMVHFPHVAVPQSFFVAVLPNLNPSTLTYTNAFTWRGDEEAQRVRTTDNARSAWVGLDEQTNQVLSAVLDGTFIANGGTTALYSNLYVTAYGTSGSAGVVLHSFDSSGSLFPNPASDRVNIPEVMHASNIQLLDMLGRPALSERVTGSRSLDVSHVAAGSYEAILQTANGIISEPLVIRR